MLVRSRQPDDGPSTPPAGTATSARPPGSAPSQRRRSSVWNEQERRDPATDGTGASPPQSCAVVTTDHRELLSTTHDKLHLDTADCGVPLSAILTSASVHDSQVAIPLAMMTAGRVTNLYDLMDSAYDAREIHQTSERLGHVPIIDVNPRRDKELKEELDREAPGPACGGPCRSRERAFPDPYRCREDQRPPQGRVRRAPCPRPGTREGRLPSHVRYPCPDGRPVDTSRRPIGRLRQNMPTFAALSKRAARRGSP